MTDHARLQTRLETKGDGLSLVVPANRADIAAARLYFLGNVVCFLGFAALAASSGLSSAPRLALFCALLGPLAGYLHRVAEVDNPITPTRFVFKDGRILVTKLWGKKLREGAPNELRIELLRRAKAGPGRLEWRWALGLVTADLCEEDFETLKRYGVRFIPKGTPTPVSTTLTRDQKNALRVWAAIWSVPWWILLGQLLFALR